MGKREQKEEDQTAMNIYLVMFTDEWSVDYSPEEAYFSKEKAEERAKELTKKQAEGPEGRDSWFYEVKEMDIKDSLVAAIHPLAEEYEQWNMNEREDGLVIHTDAIGDFLEWMKRKAK